MAATRINVHVHVCMERLSRIRVSVADEQLATPQFMLKSVDVRWYQQIPYIERVLEPTRYPENPET